MAAKVGGGSTAMHGGHVVAFAGVNVGADLELRYQVLGRDARAVAVGNGLDVRLKREGPRTSPLAAWRRRQRGSKV
jgi:hypothetical protein